jgi:hypothetical protein
MENRNWKLETGNWKIENGKPKAQEGKWELRKRGAYGASPKDSD